MAKQHFNNEIAKKILLTLAGITAVGALTITLAAMPGLGKVVKELVDWYKQADRIKQFRIRKTFEALRRARLIKNKKLADGSIILELSENGEKQILRYDFQNLKLVTQKIWDKRWRLVIFDLPKRYVHVRDVFRNKLKLLGFYQLNRSVWVHAYPCVKEINFVIEYLRISPYIRIIEALTFDGDYEVKPFFNLS